MTQMKSLSCKSQGIADNYYCTLYFFITPSQLFWAVLLHGSIVIVKHMGVRYGHTYTGTTHMTKVKRTTLTNIDCVVHFDRNSCID